jgi:hypothetical protein
MPPQPKGSPEHDAWRAQRAIIFQLLRDDHPQRWTRQQLDHEIPDFQPTTINDALARLEQEGVARFSGEHVWASRCARHLDTLEVITI